MDLMSMFIDHVIAGAGVTAAIIGAASLLRIARALERIAKQGDWPT